MATLIKKGKILHIQWFDPIDGKTHSKSTKLPATQANVREAEKYAKRLQQELHKRYLEMKQIGIERIRLKDAFTHFLRNNQHKNIKPLKIIKDFIKNLPKHLMKKLCVSI